MPIIKSKTPKIRGLNEVGRYAVGVQWIDGHDSIYPLAELRRHCPCLECNGAAEGELPLDSRRLIQLSRVGEQGVFMQWADGHESLYTTHQLRERCRCAYCIPEPEKPVTGG